MIKLNQTQLKIRFNKTLSISIDSYTDEIENNWKIVNSNLITILEKNRAIYKNELISAVRSKLAAERLIEDIKLVGGKYFKNNENEAAAIILQSNLNKANDFSHVKTFKEISHIVSDLKIKNKKISNNSCRLMGRI
mgnify:CR=1 FL=1